MVKKNFILKDLFSASFYEAYSDNNRSPLNEHNASDLNKNPDSNENNEYKNNKDKKHNYIKILVNDPFNNRNIILNVTKAQKGIYI